MSRVDFVYLNLADGGEVSPADPASSTQWHTAFRRFSVRLNGGVSGPGSVAGYNLGKNADASATEVVALTPDDGRAAIGAVTDADIPASSAFVDDGVAPDPGSTWFRFEPRIGTLVADRRATWKVRENPGRGHALFRVAELRMEGPRPLGLDTEFRRQDPGGTPGEAGTKTVDLTRGPGFAGFVGTGTPQAPGCEWDIGVSPEFAVLVNGDCGAGTFPPESAEDFTTVTRADNAPEYADYLNADPPRHRPACSRLRQREVPAESRDESAATLLGPLRTGRRDPEARVRCQQGTKGSRRVVLRRAGVPSIGPGDRATDDAELDEPVRDTFASADPAVRKISNIVSVVVKRIVDRTDKPLY